MILFIIGGQQESLIRQTAESAARVCSYAQIYSLSINYASTMNMRMAQTNSPYFMTVNAGVRFDSPFQRDIVHALQLFQDDQVGWVSFLSIGNKPQINGNEMPTLWNKHCLQKGLTKGFANRAFLPFDSLVLLDRQYQAMEHGWRGACVESANWESRPSRTSGWRKLDKELELNAPILRREPFTLNHSFDPKVSIVLCTFNDGSYLPWAIRSVLAQTHTAWELIVVDDGSTDDTQEILDTFITEPRMRCIRNERNEGKSKSLNLALQIARGSWILEIDADDWLASDCIESMLEAASSSGQDTALLHGNYHQWSEKADGELIYRKLNVSMVKVDKDKLLDNAIPLAPRFYRKDALKQVGGWCTVDPTQGRLYEDIELISRLSNSFRISHVAKPLYHQRLRLNSITHRNQHRYSEWRNWMRHRGNL
ncbi:Glycosyltransferase involved in cell wall bisynthesis [Paenibacillus sp. yr247]|uniref:glycosyltransferase family 2 protein n=1 Tax=Paenibacillus sp. yr247 TaxID=1761880 RepID=UPI00087F8E22|nr:glycosyltransferase family 2 protein [Paenibacillus sp. yr247]SDO21774.1 Glycosyltransferase involved in cell wall bisynthesis [Paenibacillus sp. yr247]